MDTWLVTGVSGFLGANAAAVLRDDVNVVGLTRDGRPLPWCPSVVSGDLRDPDSLRRAVDAVNPDVVLHCAALADHAACEADPTSAEAVNVVGSEVLAAASPGRFVLISTDAVFSGVAGNYREDDPVSPTTIYGRTKAEAEEKVSAVANALIIRTNFFGWSPSGRRSILEFFVKGLKRGERLPGFTNYRVTSTFVSDLIPRIRSLVDRHVTGVVHLTSADALTKYEFGRSVAEVFGYDPDRVTPTVSPLPERDLSLNCERAAEILGTAAPTQLAGIERAKDVGSAF